MTFWQFLDHRLNFRDMLGMFLVTAFVIALGNLLKYSFPAKNEQVIIYMLGQLSGFVGAVVTLNYGANKNDGTMTANTNEALKGMRAAIEQRADAATGKPDDPLNVKEA